jgi:PAS domain S-box-containing protein
LGSLIDRRCCGASPRGALGQPDDLGGPALQDRPIEFGRTPGIRHMPHRGDLARCSRLRDKAPCGPAGPWVAWRPLGPPIYLRTPSAQGTQRGRGGYAVINHFRNGELQLEWELPSCHHQKPISSSDESEAVTIREIIWRRLATFYIDVPALRPGTIGAYALALAAVGVATALRLALDPYLLGAQFVTFFPAVVITTLISGFGAGFFCAFLSTAAADFFVLAPRFSFAFYVNDPAALVDLLVFGPLASYVVLLIGRMRFAIEREQVEANKDRLQSALDAAKLGSWQYDPLHRIFSWDGRGKEILAVAENAATVEEFMNWVHPDDVERVWAAHHRALDPAQPERSPTQFRLRRGDGEVRWVETQGLARLRGAGRERRVVSFIGTVQDITERKEQQEREHLLMREINHRAKNMLSVVEAIAHQTAAKTREDFIERFSERIQALAANQDLLIRDEWRGVEVEDLVCAQLAPFAGLIGSRIVVRGPELRLNAASAQAIGLALHELVTNAGKYGSLSTERGRVDVIWGLANNIFTMSWTEREGPPVSAPERRGFGSIVMEAMVKRSVAGAVDLEYASPGLTWGLTCPAANVLDPAAQVRA